MKKLKRFIFKLKMAFLYLFTSDYHVTFGNDYCVSDDNEIL